MSATFVSSSTILCSAPGLPRGSSRKHVGLEFSNNGVDFSRSGMQFRYMPRPVVASISPSAGVVNGGTVVTIEGEHFVAYSDLLCQFGNTPPRRAYVSSKVIMCSALAQPRPTTVSVAVSTNGGLWQRRKRSFFVCSCGLSCICLQARSKCPACKPFSSRASFRNSLVELHLFHGSRK